MIPAEKRLELCWESIRERLPFTLRRRWFWAPVLGIM